MESDKTAAAAVATAGAIGSSIAPDLGRLLEQYGCGPVQFAGTDEALYERHLLFDNVVDPAAAGPRDSYEAIARSVRDVLSQRWALTERIYEREGEREELRVAQAGDARVRGLHRQERR